MATPISYGIGLSDQQVQAMLNSDVPEVRQQAETYLAAAQQPQKERILVMMVKILLHRAVMIDCHF